jgi:hypothetical protein
MNSTLKEFQTELSVQWLRWSFSGYIIVGIFQENGMYFQLDIHLWSTSVNKAAESLCDAQVNVAIKRPSKHAWYRRWSNLNSTYLNGRNFGRFSTFWTITFWTINNQSWNLSNCALSNYESWGNWMPLYCDIIFYVHIDESKALWIDFFFMNVIQNWLHF